MKKSFSLIFLSLLTLLCFLSGWIESILNVSGTDANILNRFADPSATHLLGTDALGRDVLIRLLKGGQVSLIVAFTAGILSAVIGASVGLLSGYKGGRWDTFLMRMTDFLIALPALPLLIILSALDLQKLGVSEATALSPHISLYKIIFIISVLGWTTTARLVRARTLTLKDMDFVRAARALGLGHARIIWRHILPNTMNTVIVAATLSIGSIILMESVLSFLGLGINPPLPSWGNMLSHAEETIWENVQLSLYPGIMISATVLAFNFFGDYLQERYRPKSIRSNVQQKATAVSPTPTPTATA